MQITPTTKAELLTRCLGLEGLSFAQVSLETSMPIPRDMNHRKGWVGQAIERFLGADAGNQSKPDFQTLGIELKTLPLGPLGKPTESTFVTAIPLLTLHKEHWPVSQCYAKLRQVLWIPVEGDVSIPYAHRRIGRGFLWSPSAVQARVLEADWTYISTQISTGHLETLDATVGEYLQVRPKAANGKSLCYAFDAQGNKVLTLPRGFYLRSSFTSTVFFESGF